MGLDRASGQHAAATTAQRWWEFEVLTPSRRSVMNDVMAGLARSQLSRLSAKVDTRLQIAQTYTAVLSECPGILTPPPLPPGHQTSGYFYWIQLPEAGARDDLASYLLERDIYSTFRYYPLHKQQIYRTSGHLPAADRAAETTLLLPVHEAMTTDDAESVAATVHRWASTRSRP